MVFIGIPIMHKNSKNQNLNECTIEGKRTRGMNQAHSCQMTLYAYTHARVRVKYIVPTYRCDGEVEARKWSFRSGIPYMIYMRIIIYTYILYYLCRCIIIIICPLVLRHRTHIVTYIMIIYSLTPKTRLPCSIYPLSVHPRYHHRMRYGRPDGSVGTTRHI